MTDGRTRRRVAGWVLGLAVGTALVNGGEVDPRLQVLSTTPAAAQVPVPEQLSFEEAVAIALENSPSYLQQVNQAASAEYSERSSLGRLLPSLRASVGFSGGWSRNKTAEDDFGQPITGEDFFESTSSTASQSLSGDISLFNLQQIRAYGAARAETDARVAAAEAGAAELRTRVGQAYYQAVLRERLVEVEERSVETAEEQLDAVRRLLRIAAKHPTDVLGAELDLAQAEQQLRQAYGERRKALLELREAMGVALETPFELESTFPEVFDPSTLDVDAQIARATAQSPSLAESRASVTAAERSQSAARAARYPSLSGSYNYGRSTSAEEYAALGEFDLPNQGWRFNVGVAIPLFNQLQTSAQVGQARVQARNARQALRAAQLQVERETRAAVIDLESAYGSVQTAETSADLARRRLEQGQELYRLGTIDYTALQQMITQVAAAERSVINAYNQFANALLQLEEKVGGPVGN